MFYGKFGDEGDNGCQAPLKNNFHGVDNLRCSPRKKAIIV